MTRTLRCFAELGARDGQRDRASIRDVEALDRARHVEPRQRVAIFAGEPAQALVLGAEDEGQRPRQGHVRQGLRSLRIEPDAPIAAIAELLKRAGEIDDAAYRHVFEAA